MAAIPRQCRGDSNGARERMPDVARSVREGKKKMALRSLAMPLISNESVVGSGSFELPTLAV